VTGSRALAPRPWSGDALRHLRQVPELDSPADTHLWIADLRATDETLDWCTQILSDSERRNAGTLRAAVHRRRSVVSRALLRVLLSRYTGIEPQRLAIERGKHGKPHVNAGHCLEFNVAHSRDRVLYGFSTRPLGVDIEAIVRRTDLSSVATHFFSPSERHALGLLQPGKYERIFYRIWTAKEAYLKALGDGLTVPLDSFSVLLVADSSCAVVDDERAASGARWTVVSLDVDDPYVAALAVDSGDALPGLALCVPGDDLTAACKRTVYFGVVPHAR